MSQLPEVSSSPARGRLRSLAWLLLGGLLGLTAAEVGPRGARSLSLDIGPADGQWVSGFNELERDGADYVRWTRVPVSRIALPFAVCGPGELRTRIRRHFEDPASLSVFVDGMEVGRREIRARTDAPYSVEIFRFPKGSCRRNSEVILETSVNNGRDLGVVVDWITLVPDGGLRPGRAVELLATLLGVVVAGIGLRLSRNWIPMLPTLAAGAIAAGLALAPMAAERALRCGVPGLIVGLGCVWALRWAATRNSEGRGEIPGLTLLVCLFLAAWSARLPFLSPEVFYPDYRVHGLVQGTLASDGVRHFADDLFTIQYARSLGLQQIGGRWYPFPYPPGAYILAQGLGSVFPLTPLESLLCLSVLSGAMVAPLTVLLGAELGASVRVSALGGAIVAFSPLLARRLALGYFPGIAGLAVDLVGCLVLIRLLRDRGEQARGLAALLAVLLAVCFLVYTQAIANFGILLTVILAAEAWHPSVSRKSTLLACAAALLGLLLAFGAFYQRYVPVFENVLAGRAQPEAHVLDRLDSIRSQVLGSEATLTDDNEPDPFSGPDLSLARGLKRVASRCWRFYGPFALLLLPSVYVTYRFLGACPPRRILIAALLIPVAIGMLASGLPSPNGFQHLKDLDLATPFIAVCLAQGAESAGRQRRGLLPLLVGSWLIYAGAMAAREWTARLVSLSQL